MGLFENPLTALKRLTEENIWVKRPGTGDIKAEHYKELIGKTVNKNIENDVHIAWSDINE